MSKILVFLANGFEEIEALTPVDLCRRAGMEVTCVSINDTVEVTGARGISVNADITLKDADFDSADMLILPGGMPGTNNLNECEPLMAKVDEFIKAGRNVSAICAAPSVILGKRGYLKGKKGCCYPGMEDGLVETNVSYDSVAVDGNLITARGMGCAIDFSLAIIEKLDSKETADKIAKSVVYR